MRKKVKPILLVLLILFSALTILSSLIITVNAGPRIPYYPNPENDWSWGVDEGDEIYFETVMIMTNLTSPTQEVMMMTRIIQIFNVTSIGNETMNYLGNDLFSVINISWLYHDPVTDELEDIPYMEDIPFAAFCFNASHTYRERYAAGQGMMIPTFLPINGSWDDEVEVLDDIIYTTYLEPMYSMGVMNKFDTYGADMATNTMWFLNSSGYYMNLTYNGSDGVLEDVNASIRMYDGYTDSYWLYEINSKRVSEYNVTDELTWGVGKGDTFYFDFAGGVNDPDDYEDLKVVITGFNESLYEVPGMMGTGFNQTFRNVLANISIWDGTQYVLQYQNVSVGSANNFYPMNMEGFTSGPLPGFIPIVPTSFQIEDMQFFINMIINFLPFPLPFDQSYTIQKGDILTVIMNSSSSNDFTHWTLNTTTGVVETQLQIITGDISIAFNRKDLPASWKWSVKPGDVLYIKENNIEYAGPRDLRATIDILGGMLINMTFWANSYGFPIYPDQPEYQFFYFVMSDNDEWNDTSKSWDDVSMSSGPIGLSNDDWAVYPLVSIPYLIPIGTTGSDFQGLFDLMPPGYDQTSINSNSIIITNSTEDKSFYLYFDGAKGMVTYFGGWFWAGSDDWTHMSTYIKNNKTLVSGVPYIIQSDQITDITATVQATTTSPGVEYLYAWLAQNPVNVSLPIGTPLYYTDQLIINDDLIDGNITMSITFPSSIDLSMVQLHMFGFNMSGTSEWDEAPSEFYDTIIYNYLTNSIIIEMTPWGSHSIISAVSYEVIQPPEDFDLDSNAGDPDDDGAFTLTWDASDGAVSYSVYRYSSYITEYNSSLVTVATGITSLSLPLTGYSNGTYYFIVEAHNAAGDTLSNCIEVVVEIPPEDGDGDGDGDGDDAIPGYPLYLLLTFFIVMTSILIKRKRKKLP